MTLKIRNEHFWKISHSLKCAYFQNFVNTDKCHSVTSVQWWVGATNGTGVVHRVAFISLVSNSDFAPHLPDENPILWTLVPDHGNPNMHLPRRSTHCYLLKRAEIWILPGANVFRPLSVVSYRSGTYTKITGEFKDSNKANISFCTILSIASFMIRSSFEQRRPGGAGCE